MNDHKFAKIRCPDCENDQILFLRSSSKVSCQVCGATMAEPTGGRASLKGEVVEKL